MIDRIADHERGLMLNYLRISNLRVGIILNFKRAELSHKFVFIGVHSWFFQQIVFISG